MSTQHTPTPWSTETYISDSTGLTCTAIYPSSEYSNRAVANMADSSGPLLNADANAAFIVRACNVYEELLQALRNVTYHGRHPDEGEDSSWAETWQDVIAAIALAEGK